VVIIVNAEGKSRAKAYTYAGGSIRGIANTDRPPDHASLRAARPLCFFFASASHELTGHLHSSAVDWNRKE